MKYIVFCLCVLGTLASSAVLRPLHAAPEIQVEFKPCKVYWPGLPVVIRVEVTNKSVQNLAAANQWTVQQGVDTPNPNPVCYQPWLAYTP